MERNRGHHPNADNTVTDSIFSYPAVVVVPCHITDDTIMKVAKNHRLNRFPVAIWRSKRTKGTLLRSGAINRSVLTAVLRTGVGNTQLQPNQVNVSEDERFFTEIGNFSS